MGNTFYMSASVTLHGSDVPEHMPANAITEIGSLYRVPAEVVDAPEFLERDVPALITFRLRVAATFGPGEIEIGKGFSVLSKNTQIGYMTIRKMSPVGMPITDPNAWQTFSRRVVDAQLLPGDEVECPTCELRFSIHDRWAWTGTRHRVCQQRLTLVGLENQVEPVWCMVGNMVEERAYGVGGGETRRGTAYFAPGTKLYCLPRLHGHDESSYRLEAVGLARKPKQYIQIWVNLAWVTNRRVRMIYEPKIVDKLSGYWDASEQSRRWAESLAELK